MATIKVASLLLKTLAKPLARKIKELSKSEQSDSQLRSMTLLIGQSLHKAETRMRLSLLGDTTHRAKPLNEAKAMDQGAEVISEGFLFLVAVGISEPLIPCRRRPSARY